MLPQFRVDKQSAVLVRHGVHEDVRGRRERAEDIGITAVMSSPSAGLDGMGSGGAERFRGPIERFAETIIIAKVR
jgi:hypothetical protein